MSDRAMTLSSNEHRSAGDILRSVVQDLQDLVNSELRLAKAEVGQEVDHAKRAVAMLAPAAGAGLLATLCLTTACIAALSLIVPVWAAALIMTGLLGAACAVLYRRGADRLKLVKAVPEQTVRNIKRDVETIKESV